MASGDSTYVSVTRRVTLRGQTEKGTDLLWDPLRSLTQTIQTVDYFLNIFSSYPCKISGQLDKCKNVIYMSIVSSRIQDPKLWIRKWTLD